jgi:hypothetical protein
MEDCKMETKPEETYVLTITESEAWAVATALMEYSKDAVSQEQCMFALTVYNQLKEIMIERSKQRFLNSR